MNDQITFHLWTTPSDTDASSYRLKLWIAAAEEAHYTAMDEGYGRVIIIRHLYSEHDLNQPQMAIKHVFEAEVN